MLRTHTSDGLLPAKQRVANLSKQHHQYSNLQEVVLILTSTVSIVMIRGALFFLNLSVHCYMMGTGTCKH